MLPHKLTFGLLILFFLPFAGYTQSRRPPAGGRLAVVVDERLAAVRTTPQLTGKLVRRLGRGRLVALRTTRSNPDGLTFLLVNVTSRTQGWIQREALAAPSRRGDDRRLLALIQGSQGFDRIARARIFLDHFPRSPLRPEVLLLLGDSAADAAERLTKAAQRKINSAFTEATEISYYLNYSGLDRYNRLRVGFVFDETTKRLRYDGAAWRELVRVFPKSPQAAEARRRLEQK